MNRSIHLLDLIEKEKLDDFLIAFTNVTGIASIIAHVDGQPITRSHNFSVLCQKYCRTSEAGKRKCWESDRYGGQQAAKLKARFIYKCLNAGLLDSAYPIIIDGYHLATALCGQVLTEPIAEDAAIERAISIGVVDVKGYLHELEKIPLMNLESFDRIVNLMGVVTRTISELALQKYLSYKNSQHYLDKLINSVPDGIISLNDNATISMTNDACAKMFGLKKDKIIGKSIYSLLHDASSIKALQKQMELSLEGNRRAELTAVDSKNKTFPIQISISSTKNDDHKISGYVAIFRDISEEKKNEKMKKDLIGMLTHDMGNPVLSIQKAVQLMVDGTLGQLNLNQMEVMNLALGTSHQLLGMVKDFLDIYRNENDKFFLHKISMDINQMIYEGIDYFKIFALDKQISIRPRLFPIPLIIEGDWNRLMRTFSNLLDNAIKFSPKGSEIKISSNTVNKNNKEKYKAIIGSSYLKQLQPGQNYALITVADQGSGIPEAHQQFIFEKFFTYKSREKKGRKGLGLGLAFCKLAVEAHDGFIWAISPFSENNKTTEQGCCFSIILPINSADPINQ